MFERAQDGTVFLDEITEMPLSLQSTLLRVLRAERLRRVGGSRELQTNARVIAATNRDPIAAVRDGYLRDDLYYRLSACIIETPSLRVRPDDIEDIAQGIAATLGAVNGIQKALSADTLAALKSHPLPGNVRALKNLITRAYYMTDEVVIYAKDLELPTSGLESTDKDRMLIQVGMTVREVERTLIEATLTEIRNKRRAAQTLGISLKTLYNRLTEYHR